MCQSHNRCSHILYKTHPGETMRGNLRRDDIQDARPARRARRSMLQRQSDTPVSSSNSAVTLTVAGANNDEQSGPSSSEHDNNENGNGEEIDDDDACPICQLMLYNPVTTTCRHTLCKFCMATWASVSLAAPMIIVDVDEEPVPFDAVSELEARCPMCRMQTTASDNAQRAAHLKATYPQKWAERAAEVEADRERRAEGGDGIQTMTVYIGNRHETVSPSGDDLMQNRHEWTFFVKPSRTDIVEEVHIFLHPTFRENHIIRQRPPYQISRLGWGIFTITASVILKAGYAWVSDDAQDSPDGAAKGMLPLEWTLDFDGFGGKGSMGRCKLKVKHDRGWQDDEAERDNREWNRMVRQYERDGRYEPGA
ncbi:uncharacterized protein BCR38DRAFT_426106 [Pseudomassariella vexata]|uniref:Uncharacterized protein n=1 Tax=Pseudomassariella vexata TaxID=1141098 RepID=A0A1Y2E6B7_9PEZI|nr:uncharacterized protein BCR38DRAFT_426106 [Pseudomassariella vexata]ORY67108.1 hypothetical protein BCR38DRAFT_426106 [Pseudomassariella vexata]